MNNGQRCPEHSLASTHPLCDPAASHRSALILNHYQERSISAYICTDRDVVVQSPGLAWAALHASVRKHHVIGADGLSAP